MSNPPPKFENRLHQAICAAYNFGSLEQMVCFQLNERLDLLAPDRGSFSEVVFALIRWADQQGRMRDLLNEAASFVPERPDIAALKEEFLAGDATTLRLRGATTLRIDNVPYQRNPNFTGRPDYLSRIHAHFFSADTTVHPLALCGMGGIGKTQIINEYVYRHKSDYQLIWWIRSEEPGTLSEDLAALAVALELPASKLPLRYDRINAVRKHLEGQRGWLLLFDNAEDPGFLSSILPRTNGHILITSRNPNWGELAIQWNVNIWDRKESAEFLLKRISSQDTAACEELAEALGDLPLALNAAAAYMSKTGVSPKQYLDLFANRHQDLWGRERKPIGYDDTVATTWSVAIHKILETEPEAARLLEYLARFGSGSITHYQSIAAESKSKLSDPITFNDSIVALRNFSLIERNGDMLFIHPVIRRVVTDSFGAQAGQTHSTPREYGWFFRAIKRITSFSWVKWPVTSDAKSVPDDHAFRGFQRFDQSGPELINKIVQSIGLNQSVLLLGPRGCGKSYCVDQAIKKATEAGILETEATFFIIGNREIPSDYLSEDSLSINYESTSKERQPHIYNTPSPLFRFARLGRSGEPLVDNDGELICGTGPDLQRDCKRFVLFLDEVHRFSNGFIDSLVSLLDDRKVVRAGRQYSVPLVICMTATPPGQDYLVANYGAFTSRVNQLYRMCVPEHRTLSLIITGKLTRMNKDRMRVMHDSASSQSGCDERDLCLPGLPLISTDLISKVGIYTLLCCGDNSRDRTLTTYLTSSTTSLIELIIHRDPIAKATIRELAQLCSFPSFDFGASWMMQAVELARQSREKEPREFRLQPKHLIDTVVSSVCHRLYNKFSEGTRPDLAARKEFVLLTLCRQVFQHPIYDEILRDLKSEG